MKILNFGSANIDYVYTLDHIVGIGETETSSNFEVFPGGKGLNQSIALSRAGVKVYHAGCIGKDGEFLSKILERNGVNISYLKKTDGKNGHAVIQVNRDGENSIFIYPGSNETVSKEHIDNTLQNFGEGDIILLQNEINCLKYIIEQAYKKGMCIILNPSPMNGIIHTLDLNKLSYIILNEVEAKSISRYDRPEKCLEHLISRYPKLCIMLTLGKNGCIYRDKNQSLYHPIFETVAVDTTAAGDTFTGYFVAGISQGEDLKNILRVASCASALAVSRRGAEPSIPEKHEVLQALTSLKTRPTDKKAEIIKEKLKKYVDENAINACLDDFAKELGYTSIYTGVLVKNITGKSFKKHIQEKRLDLAARLLLDSDVSVGEIIKQVGYENESHFREMFKNKYKQNPLKYRKAGGYISDK